MGALRAVVEVLKIRVPAEALLRVLGTRPFWLIDVILWVLGIRMPPPNCIISYHIITLFSKEGKILLP